MSHLWCRLWWAQPSRHETRATAALTKLARSDLTNSAYHLRLARLSSCNMLMFSLLVDSCDFRSSFHSSSFSSSGRGDRDRALLTVACISCIFDAPEPVLQEQLAQQPQIRVGGAVCLTLSPPASTSRKQPTSRKDSSSTYPPEIPHTTVLLDGSATKKLSSRNFCQIHSLVVPTVWTKDLRVVENTLLTTFQVQ